MHSLFRYVSSIAGRWTNFSPSVTFDVAMHSLHPSPRSMIRVPFCTMEIQSFWSPVQRRVIRNTREKRFQKMMFTVYVITLSPIEQLTTPKATSTSTILSVFVHTRYHHWYVLDQSSLFQLAPRVEETKRSCWREKFYFCISSTSFQSYSQRSHDT